MDGPANQPPRRLANFLGLTEETGRAAKPGFHLPEALALMIAVIVGLSLPDALGVDGTIGFVLGFVVTVPVFAVMLVALKRRRAARSRSPTVPCDVRAR